MSDTARLVIGENSYELPVVVGTEGDRAVDITQAAADHRAHHPRRRLHEHRLVRVGHHLRRRRERGILRYRGIPIEQLASQEHLRRDLLAAHLRRAAHQRAAQGLERSVHQVRDDPRGPLPPLRRLPLHRPPHGHPLGHDQRHELLRTGPDGDGETPPPSRSSAARLISKLRTIAAAGLQGLHRPADRLSQAAPGLLHQLPAHDVLHPLRGLRARPGDGGRAAAHPHPARRPRAELLVQHRAHGRLLGRQPVRQLRGRRVRPVGPSARRGQRRRRGDAAGPSRQQRRPQRLHRPGQGQGLPAPAHGLRPPRLQELRPPGQHHEGDRPTSCWPSSRAPTRCSRSPSGWRTSP